VCVCNMLEPVCVCNMLELCVCVCNMLEPVLKSHTRLKLTDLKVAKNCSNISLCLRRTVVELPVCTLQSPCRLTYHTV